MSDEGSVRVRRWLFVIPAVSAAFLFLASCGFQPMNGKAYQASQPLDLSVVGVEVATNVLEREASATSTTLTRRYYELLQAEITDQTAMNTSTAPRQFLVKIGLTESQSGQFVNPDGTASRGEL